ncbi:MAG: hypothetical protein U1G07_24510 [Verrucomicrobiota bacterium]
MKRRERENLLVVLDKTGWKIKGPNGGGGAVICAQPRCFRG